MKLLRFLLVAVLGLSAGAANANWSSTNDRDDGSRFYFAVRGGLAMGLGGETKNQLGGVTDSLWYDPDTGYIYSESQITNNAGLEYLGTINLGDLKTDKNFDVTTWTAGVGIGVVLPNMSNVRLEASWDKISESSYNASPVFSGDLITSNNTPITNTDAGSLTSKVATDIFMAMAYFDFFEGSVKRPFEVIPYVGLGIGYSVSQVSMSLIDSTGNLNATTAFDGFIDSATGGYYHSENYNNGFAAAVAGGISYGINSFSFIDLGAKIILANKVEWNLVNPNSGMEKTIVSTSGPMIYGILNAGFRFEF